LCVGGFLFEFISKDTGYNKWTREDFSSRKESDRSLRSSDYHQDELVNARMSYDEIFQIVKRSVRKVTRLERSGLGLALSDLPATVGAYWQVGGNYIVMNETLVKAMSRIASSLLEFNSFVFSILAHEYLHSVGFINEAEARAMTALVTREYFGPSHPASILSNWDLWSVYPELLQVHGGDGSRLKIVNRFDSDSTSYMA
jgi:hypothetical protein